MVRVNHLFSSVRKVHRNSPINIALDLADAPIGLVRMGYECSGDEE